MIKTCECCGKQYEPKRKGQKYCCTSCGKKGKKISRVCLVCKKTFVTNDKGARKFCSDKCRGTTRIKKVPLTCVGCGEIFVVTPYYAYRKYCSRGCFGKAHAGEKNRNWLGGKMKKTCEYCGTEYEVLQARKDTAKYCSQICYGKAESGDLNPGWRGGGNKHYPQEWTRKLKRTIRTRDMHTCQFCGGTGNYRALDVHHIDYNKDNCHPANLISLCGSCHMKTNTSRHHWQQILTQHQQQRNI